MIARRILGFSLVPAIAAFAPIVSLFAITQTHGPDAWAAIAIGQSLGMAGGVIVELGWSLTGPQLVAPMSRQSALAVTRRAMWTKLVTLAPTALIAASLAVLLAPDDRWEAALMACAACAYGLTIAWLFIGRGSVAGVLWFDAIPKSLVTVGTSLLLFVGLPLWALPASMILIAVAAPFAGVWWFGRGVAPVPALSQTFWQTFRSQLTPLSARGASALYTALPISLVAIVASPVVVAEFATVERLMRMVLTALQSVPNAMQAWVGSAADSLQERSRRLRRALGVNVALGATAAVAFALLGPFGVSLLSGGSISTSIGVTAMASAVVFLTCTSRATGSLALVASGRVGAIAVSAIVGAGVGVVGVPVLAGSLASVGGFLGEALAESAVLGVQLTALKRAHDSSG